MRFRSAAFFVLLGLFSLPGSAQHRSPQAIVYYYDRMPFFGDPEAAEDGFLLKIVKLVFAEAGVPFRFEKTPVSRIFESLKNPGFGCVAGAFKTPEREKLYRFSADPIYRDEPPHYVILSRNISRFRSVRTIKDLLTGPHVLGVVASYSYGRWVDESIALYGPTRQVVNVGDNQDNFFRMLLAGRFDYLFSGLEEARWNLRTNDDYRESLTVMTLDDAPFGNERWLMFNKEFPDDLLDRVDAAVARVKAGKEYRLIVEAAKR